MKTLLTRVRALIARRRKLAAVAIALVALELAAAATAAVVGREWIENLPARARAESGRPPAVGMSGSLAAPSIAVL
jgi:hypothetical protein